MLLRYLDDCSESRIIMAVGLEAAGKEAGAFHVDIHRMLSLILHSTTSLARFPETEQVAGVITVSMFHAVA
jgi:hypothetical protein